MKIEAIKEILGYKNVLTPEETYINACLAGVYKGKMDEFCRLFNRKEKEIDQPTLTRMRGKSNMVPLIGMNLATIERWVELINAEEKRIVIRYASKKLQRKLHDLPPTETEWRLVAYKSERFEKADAGAIAPHITQIIQAAITLFLTREKNILGLQSMCRETVLFLGKTQDGIRRDRKVPKTVSLYAKAKLPDTGKRLLRINIFPGKDKEQFKLLVVPTY